MFWQVNVYFYMPQSMIKIQPFCHAWEFLPILKCHICMKNDISSSTKTKPLFSMAVPMSIPPFVCIYKYFFEHFASAAMLPSLPETQWMPLTLKWFLILQLLQEFWPLYISFPPLCTWGVGELVHRGMLTSPSSLSCPLMSTWHANVFMHLPNKTVFSKAG